MKKMELTIKKIKKIKTRSLKYITMKSPILGKSLSSIFFFKNLHKISLFIFILILLSNCFYCQTVFAAPATDNGGDSAGDVAFKDLTAKDPIYPYVRYLVEKGIVKGFPDGTFHPAGNVTRAQAAKVIVLAKGLQPLKNVSFGFIDLPPGYWAYGEIEAALKAGLLKGYPDGAFGTENTITRAEAAALLIKLTGGELSGKVVDIQDVSPDHWAYRTVAIAIEAGLVKLPPDKLFYPDRLLRRDELARGATDSLTLGSETRASQLTGKLEVKKRKSKSDLRRWDFPRNQQRSIGHGRGKNSHR